MKRRVKKNTGHRTPKFSARSSTAPNNSPIRHATEIDDSLPLVACRGFACNGRRSLAALSKYNAEKSTTTKKLFTLSSDFYQ